MRLAIPLIAGIAIGWMCNIMLLHILSVFALSLVMLSLGMMQFAPKWLFGVGVTVFMLSVGMFVESRQSVEKEPQWSEMKCEYTAYLMEMPALRGTNVKVLAELLSGKDSVADNERTKGLVYLYFPRNVDTEILSAGDVVAFESTVSLPRHQGNPYEFDIENYYYIKGVTGTAFVPDGKWKLLPQKRNSLQIHALKLRAKAIALYERLGFEKESLALLSALTLGEKRDFPKDLKESYSAAGASHILALSGLHLGILYMLLAFVFPLRGQKILYRVLRELIIVATLWGFAFVAGLSPSVVRSATLFTLISLARLLASDISSVNSLSFAAIVMLLFSPHQLFDVSFQLSFAAVLSILLLAPPLQELAGVYKHGIVYGYLANLLILSVVAQVGTLPFVWYHFGVFPLYFLLTNLFVIPLAFLVLMLVAVMWSLAPLPLLQQGVAWVLAKVIALMNLAVKGVAVLPGASFMLPSIGVFSAICVAVLLVLLLVALFQKRWWLLALVSCSIVSLISVYLLYTTPVNKGDYMIIYNNHKNPLLHIVYESGTNYLVSTVPQLDAEYEYVSKPLLQHESLNASQWVSWEYADSLVQCNEGRFLFNGMVVKMLDNAYWRENENTEPVDILVLCRGFLGRIDKLVAVYPAACVVVDGSLYKHSRERIKREYARLGMDVVDITQTGAVKVVAGTDGFDLMPVNGK